MDDLLEREAGLLRRSELRKFLSEEEIEQLHRFCRSSERRGGSTIFRQGDAADVLHILAQGGIELRAKPPGRHAYRTVELVGPGCTFGDEAIFGEGTYLFAARTLQSSRLLALPRSQFEALATSHPNIAQQVLRCAGSCLKELVRRSAILSQAPADVSLQELLHELATGSARANGRPVPLRITHAQLAGVLHLSRETVSRMLSRMAAQGKVELGRGVIRVRRS
jgi:CRP-like cAMP-binding protein